MWQDAGEISVNKSTPTPSRLGNSDEPKSAIRLLTSRTMNISSHENLGGKVTATTSNDALEGLRAHARNAGNG